MHTLKVCFLLIAMHMAAGTHAQVAPLVQTAWHQRPPYSDLCPDGMLAGCVAIAMAQVMNYFRYPAHGIGSSKYSWLNPQTKKRETLSADYASTYYRWDDMDGERISAAQLIYHCGVSVWMDYSPSFSGSSEYYAKSALVDYFGYSDSIKLEARNKYTDEEWATLLKSNLDKGWPIIYSSGGHTFIVDGYNAEGLFHTNQGFGSVSNAYTYTLDALGSKSTSTALVNIHPDHTSQANLTEPYLIIYEKEGTSRQIKYSNLKEIRWTPTNVLVDTEPDKATIPLRDISYIKPLVPDTLTTDTP